MEDVDKLKHLGSMFVANGQGTEEIRKRIKFARSTFSRLQSCLWSRRTKDRAYQAVVCSILLYGCETWPVRVTDERMLEVFDNDSIRRILRGAETVCHLWNCVAASALQACRHCSCKEGSAGLVMPQDVPTIKANLEPFSGPQVFGHARWRKDWMKVSSELAQERRAWCASDRDVVNAISDVGSTRPG